MPHQRVNINKNMFQSGAPSGRNYPMSFLLSNPHHLYHLKTSGIHRYDCQTSEKNILSNSENIDIDWKFNVLINSKILFDVDNIDCLFDKLRCDLQHDTSAFCKTLKKDDRISIHRPCLPKRLKTKQLCTFNSFNK